jgi:GLPGLI family protein
MKTLIKIIIILITSVSLNAQTTTAIITYKKAKIKKTFTDDKKEKLGKDKLKRFAAVEEETDKAANNLSFSLSYSNNHATFKVNDFMETPNNSYIKLALLPYGNGEYYNSPTERIKLMDSFGELFMIYYPKNEPEWTLQKETKKIGKYTAYKAIIKEKVKSEKGFIYYNITAWYTPEINIQYGPIGYSGLPGLILELQKNNIIYYTTNIELNPKKIVKINKPTKGKKITEEEYNDMALNAMSRYKKIRG